MKRRSKIILIISSVVMILSTIVLPVFANSYSEGLYAPEDLMVQPFTNTLGGRVTLIAEDKSESGLLYVYDLTDVSASPPISFWLGIKNNYETPRESRSIEIIQCSQVGSLTPSTINRLYIESIWTYHGNGLMDRYIRIPLGDYMNPTAGRFINNRSDFYTNYDLTIVREDFYVTQQNEYEWQGQFVDTQIPFMRAEFKLTDTIGITHLERASNNASMPCYKNNGYSQAYYKRVQIGSEINSEVATERTNTPCYIDSPDSTSIMYYIPEVSNNEVDYQDKRFPIAKWYYNETSLNPLHAEMRMIEFGSVYRITNLSMNGNTPQITAIPQNIDKEITFDSLITEKTVLQPIYETIDVGSGFTEWIMNSVSGIFELQLTPWMTLGDMLELTIVLGLFIAILKIFLGG